MKKLVDVDKLLSALLCTKHGVYCPDDSEYFCAYGEYTTNGVIDNV